MIELLRFTEESRKCDKSATEKGQVVSRIRRSHASMGSRERVRERVSRKIRCLELTIGMNSKRRVRNEMLHKKNQKTELYNFLEMGRCKQEESGGDLVDGRGNDEGEESHSDKETETHCE